MGKDFKETLVINWQIIDDCLAENTVSGYKMALIEADKLLDNSLKKAGYPGKNIEERINSAKSLFSNIKSLKKAREKEKTVLEELSYNLNSLEVEEAAKAYYQALLDIEGNPEAKLSILGRIFASISYYIPSKKKFFAKILIYFVSVLLAVVFLADTKTGQKISAWIISFSHFVFGWVLMVFILLGAVITIVTLSLLYFEKRKKDDKQEFDL